ncbi:transglycosylase domain-containing protein [Luteimonas deserti]|uniref:Transglycosylase domain-containing protein n=1 Tax=Luteimonas deserti TaxID=2752306 RepID=A0A7Z0QPR5_9GAMM|nr:transglycosylase domain-containing protein [Luteimonas deserti]NYZ62577.1 transglycosylase domain-containing protein [Luteimonas deserti]
MRRGLAAIALALVSYLVIVALWANSVARELLQATPGTDRRIELDSGRLAALLAIEDPAFYSHRGLDMSDGQGLTTMTSVVARDLFLHGHDLDGWKGVLQSAYREVFSCCKKVDLGRDVMALVLHSHASKQQQFNLFLNNAYWGAIDGRAVVGIEAAAGAYYGEDAHALTDDKFFGLIAMLIAPNRFHPLIYPEDHAERTSRITKVVTGRCAPSGWLDLTYAHCDGVD